MRPNARSEITLGNFKSEKQENAILQIDVDSEKWRYTCEYIVFEILDQPNLKVPRVYSVPSVKGLENHLANSI